MVSHLFEQKQNKHNFNLRKTLLPITVRSYPNFRTRKVIKLLIGKIYVHLTKSIRLYQNSCPKSLKPRRKSCRYSSIWKFVEKQRRNIILIQVCRQCFALHRPFVLFFSLYQIELLILCIYLF